MNMEDRDREQSPDVVDDPYMHVDQEGEESKNGMSDGGDAGHHPGQTINSPRTRERGDDGQPRMRRHVTQVFTMSGGGNLERAVEGGVLDEGEVYHECDEPRIHNLLGQGSDGARAAVEPLPDW